TIKCNQITARVSVSARVFVYLPMNPGSPRVGGAGRDADWKLRPAGSQGLTFISQLWFSGNVDKEQRAETWSR
ncbi:hypothetical protein KUCAC02_012922, partial [Chaenocephalus aceratus]